MPVKQTESPSTSLPTSITSQIPSTDPSATPSSAPSNCPTQISIQPSTGVPTTLPSMQPTTPPSNKPSCSPTVKPFSSNPSRQHLHPHLLHPHRRVSHRQDHPDQHGVPPGTLRLSQLLDHLQHLLRAYIPSYAPPTSKPSRAPTSRPTFFPSSSPTSKPSSAPTSRPTFLPTNPPSAKPSANPTSKPSFVPSTIPTFKPSITPTSKPSALPTCDPTRKPSREPSASPTRLPTFNPTPKPSRCPTFRPSSIPTGIPTSMPSGIILTDTIKRGLVINGTPGDPRKVNAHWYYNYKPARTHREQWGIQFYPMYKDPSYLAPLVVSCHDVLSFNEPDVPTSGAAHMTPMEALKLWPKFDVLFKGKRIGAPANTKRYIFSWLSPFLAGNGTYSPNIEFINVHWYDLDPRLLIAHIDKVYETFNLPIWLTEFSMADWMAAKFGYESSYNDADVIKFLNYAIPALENRPYVEKYAWYSDINDPAMDFASLWNRDKTPSNIGLMYAGTLNVTKSYPTLQPSLLGAIGSGTKSTSASASEDRTQTILFVAVFVSMTVCGAILCAVYWYYRVLIYKRPILEASEVTEANDQSISNFEESLNRGYGIFKQDSRNSLRVV